MTNNESEPILVYACEDINIKTHSKRAIVEKLINDKRIVRVTPWFDLDIPVGALWKATEDLINNPYIWREDG